MSPVPGSPPLKRAGEGLFCAPGDHLLQPARDRWHVLLVEDVVALTRLLPLERDGVLVGAVGVSGGDSAQDQRAVEAGVRAFAPGG